MNAVPSKDVDFAAMLHAHLDGTNFASASLFTALYRVACSRARVPVIDARAEEGLIRPSLFEACALVHVLLRMCKCPGACSKRAACL